MEDLLQDVRYAARSLLKAPSFALLAAATLALGIGANTAIFSVVRGVLLAPLTYEQPDEIVRVWPGRNFSKQHLTALEDVTTLEVVSGYHGATFSLTEAGEPEELMGTAVATGYFKVLGARPGIGRAFRAEDRNPGAEPVVVISHGLWERRFGSDPDIVGRAVSLSGLGHGLRTVVGVMPDSFRPLANRRSQLWVPLTFDPSLPDDFVDMFSLRALGRLAPGATLTQADAEIKAFAHRLQEENPSYFSDRSVSSAGVTPLHEMLTGGIRPTLKVLLAAAGLVLLIGCSNIANMLLARARGQHREMAIRSALGAGKARLMRQLLTESALLGTLGGGAGLLAAVWLEPFLLRSLPASVPRLVEIGVGSEELAFAAFLSLLAALIFGCVPAFRATRPDLPGSLRDGGARSSAGPLRQRLNQSLVTAEVALAVILVAGAGLMLKSLWHLHQVEPGFEAEQLMAFRVAPAADRYPDAARLGSYYRDVVERVRALPGVTSASAIDYLPMTGSNVRLGFSTEDHPVADGERPLFTNHRTVTPGYHQTMGIPLLAGRGLTETDRVGAPEVGLINDNLARQLWPGKDPIGKEMLWDDGSAWFTVVGVVGDVRQHRLNQETRAEVYRPVEQAFNELSPGMYLTVRSPLDESALIHAVRDAAWAVDGNVPISRVGSMDEVIATSLAGSRFFALLLTVFGALALVLGAVGVYGVGSYMVSQRTREFGVRMALGARRRTMLRSVMARELTPVALGIGIGVVGALAATRVLSSSLFNVAATDPVTHVAVALVLGAVAMAASYWPARRASKVDPIIALRSE